jgi:hypothetical protein
MNVPVTPMKSSRYPELLFLIPENCQSYPQVKSVSGSSIHGSVPDTPTILR